MNTVPHLVLDVMSEVRDEQAGDRVVLRSDNEGEWIESDSVVELPDWV